MAGRRTNLALFVLLAVSVATGALAFSAGTAWGRGATVAHGVSGFGIVLLMPWKQVVARRGLQRRRVAGTASLLLGLLVAAAVVSGLLMTAGVRRMGGFTAMQVHVGAALTAVPLVVWHVVARPTRPRRTDLDRRNLLRAGALTGAAGAAWVAYEGTMRVASLPGADRRFTGSHEVGSFRPREMPVVQWVSDSVQRIDPDEWRLSLADARGERALRYADVIGGTDHVQTVLDCTGGWWSRQDWDGVRLDRIVEAPGDARSLVVRSVTGYRRRFPLRDLDSLLLAVRLGGEPLTPGHGYPARLVAPGRRGFWWVKWVDRIETSSAPWWWQSPFPLQ